MVFSVLSSFNALSSLFKKEEIVAHAKQLYSAAVKAARAPQLFTEYGVADSVDGRFDLISLHVFLIQRRLLSIGTPAARQVSQELSNVMWSDMDDGIREIGVGDLSVPKHLKKMIGAYQGRVAAYSDALAASEEALAKALWRNVYREAPDQHQNAQNLAAYANQALMALMETAPDRVLEGDVHFPWQADGPAPTSGA